MSKLLQYLRTNTFRNNLIGALIALALLFLGIYLGLKWYTKHGVSIAVPEVKGMHINDAVKTLKKADLEYSIDHVYQLDVQPGLVIEQDPDPQSHVKTGRTIYLTIITETPPEVAFPNIIDKTLIEASAMLRNLSLKVADTVYVADIARDVVRDVKFAGQPLKPGRLIPKGSQITLVLGNGQGADDVEVPNLIGLSLSEARFSLQGHNLNLGNISYSASVTDSLTATIVAQQPDTTVAFISMGSAINVTLSN